MRPGEGKCVLGECVRMTRINENQHWEDQIHQEHDGSRPSGRTNQSKSRCFTGHIPTLWGQHTPQETYRFSLNSLSLSE